MKTPEQLVKEALNAVSYSQMGEWYRQLGEKYRSRTSGITGKIPNQLRAKKYHNKGCLLLAKGEAKLKRIQEDAGRLKKKMKTLKKYRKLVTLTAINDVPWIVSVKK